MSVNPIPEGFNTLTPYLIVEGADKAIDFYQRALGAELISRMPDPQGLVLNAQLRIGDSVLMLSDEYPEWGSVGPLKLGGSASMTHVYVEDVDAAWARVMEAGAEAIMPPSEMFWGDRYGSFKDPFGHKWSIASRVAEPTPEEVQAAAQAAFASAENGRQ